MLINNIDTNKTANKENVKHEINSYSMSATNQND